jgi:hypothetical protein
MVYARNCSARVGGRVCVQAEELQQRDAEEIARERAIDAAGAAREQRVAEFVAERLSSRSAVRYPRCVRLGMQHPSLDAEPMQRGEVTSARTAGGSTAAPLLDRDSTVAHTAPLAASPLLCPALVLQVMVTK